MLNIGFIVHRYLFIPFSLLYLLQAAQVLFVQMDTVFQTQVDAMERMTVEMEVMRLRMECFFSCYSLMDNQTEQLIMSCRTF